MARIQEVAGLISETLGLDPLVVDGHVRGLRGAGRIGTGVISDVEAIDLLCACISTDPVNATSLFHLPFTDAVIQAGDLDYVGPGHDVYRTISVAFGEALRQQVWNLREREHPEVRISGMSISGNGPNMVAQIFADVETDVPDSKAFLHYGYQLAADRLKHPKTKMNVSHNVNGEILTLLSLLLSSRDVPEANRPLKVECRAGVH